jgi:hypothetical protein
MVLLEQSLLLSKYANIDGNYLKMLAPWEREFLIYKLNELHDREAQAHRQGRGVPDV